MRSGPTVLADAGLWSGEELRIEVGTAGTVLEVRSSGDAPVWKWEQVLRPGTVEGGPEEFCRVRSLVADPDRNLYVADNLSPEVEHLDLISSTIATIHVGSVDLLGIQPNATASLTHRQSVQIHGDQWPGRHHLECCLALSSGSARTRTIQGDRA